MDQTFYYAYNGNYNITEINVYDHQDGIFTQRYIYEYNSNQLLLKRSFQIFDEGMWKDNVLYYYTYNTDNLLWKLTVRELKETGWTYTERYIYRYDMDNNLTGYMLQKWISNKWTNWVVNSYTYNDYLILTGTTESRVSDNEVYRQNYYSYDKNLIMEERLVQVKNEDDIWENTLWVEYVSDNRGRTVESYNYLWNNGEWINDVMRKYHYESDHPHKAEICHKGQTICVSVNAVHAHLAHGDFPGKCTDSETAKTSGDLKSEYLSDISSNNGEIAVYPNPFNGRFFIALDEYDDVTEIEIFDYTGKLVKCLEHPGVDEIELDMTDLPRGIYFLRTTGTESFSVRLISQ
jgi:hypothetical protein